MASLIANGKQQYFDNAGRPLVGGKLYTYAAGTATPKATYADADAAVANPNPIVLDARGEALVFWSGSYKIILKDALGNTIYTVDKVTETNLGFRTSSNGSAITPSGTTAQRDAAPLPGYFRFNVDLNSYEGRYNAAWTSLVKSFNGAAVPDGGDVLVKTLNGGSLLGAGDIPIKTVGGNTLFGAGDITYKTLGGVSLFGVGDIAVQAPLVSGTNLKTINGISLLAAGDLVVGQSLVKSARAANTILVGGDVGKLIDMTTTFTQTFTAVATLGSGWYCWLRNSGAGDITLDPNGAELIDGLASYIMYPGEVRLVQCDGTTLTTVVVSPFLRKYTASGTFVKPPGYSYFGGNLWSGGGSGALGATGNYCFGGGGGACTPFFLAATYFGASETITIGAGGIAQTVASTVGNPGGNTTIGAFLISIGAAGGGQSSGAISGIAFSSSTQLATFNTAQGGGFSGSAAPGAPSVYGGGGSGGYGSTSQIGGVGGFSVWGGGGGGTVGTNFAAAGGVSMYAGNGSPGRLAGGAGTAPVPSGGGGGAIAPATASDAGGRGEVHIWGVA